MSRYRKMFYLSACLMLALSYSSTNRAEQPINTWHNDNAATQILAMNNMSPAKYISESKQRQINELILRAERDKLQHRWLWTLIGGGLLMLIGATVLLWRLRRANQRLKLEIDERHRVAAARSESERQFRTLVEHTPDSIARYDKNCRRIYANPSMQADAGIPIEDLLNKTPEEFPGGEMSAVYQARMRHVLESGEPADFELNWRSGDGREHNFHIRLVPEYDAEGNVTTVLGVGRDITERKQTEETVRQLNANLSATLRAIPDLMFELDGNGMYINIYANNPALLAAPKDALLGHTIAEMLPPEAAEVSMAALHEADEKEYSYGKIIRLDLAEGTRWFELSVAKKNEAHGADARFISMSRDITDRKVAEDALRESEEEYRTLLQKIQAAVVVHGADSRIITTNSAAQEILGLTGEQLFGQKVITPAWRFSREDGSLMPQDEYPVNIVLASHKPLRNYEVQVHRPNRENDVWVLVNADPVFGKHSELTQVIVTFFNITERKEAERLVHEQDQAIRAVVENSPDTITRYDKHCRRIFVNPAMAKLCGLPREKLLDKTPLESSPVPETQVYVQAIRKVFESGQEFHMELPFRMADGEMGWGDLRLAPEFGTDSAVISVLVIGRDITQRKRAEEALAVREREFRTLAENSPDIIMRYDLECRRIYVNPTFERATGFLKEQALNAKPDTQWPSNVTMPVEEYQSHLREVMETGETKLIVIGWPWHDEKGLLSTQYYDVGIVPEYDTSGRTIGVLAMGRNITALKEAEKRLEQTQIELRELIALRETALEEERHRIARELHDELGQLLSAIRIKISMLKMQYDLDNPQFQDKMQRIVGLVDKTIKGVRGVVSLLRPDALEAGIIAALKWLVDDFTARTGIPCSFQRNEEDIDIDQDRAIAIFRILQESLTNIIRHAEASRVNVSLEHKSDGDCLRIRDNGKGFDPSALKKNSLGLVGIRERVFMLNGEVVISSSPGQGTTIEAYLPLKKAESHQESPE